MQFVKDNDLYKIIRISGITNNYLAIRLSEEKCCTEITALPMRPGQVATLDGDDVLTQVLNGLDRVNKELGKEYYVSEVQYVPSDTFERTIYAYLTRALIMKIDSREEFA